MDILKPDILVEMGTHKGTSFFAFCQAVRDLNLSTKCFAIDNWLGDEHAGFYSDQIYDDFSTELETYQSFATAIRDDFKNAIEKFSDNSIDVLHIDGFHTYEAAKNDFNTYLPKVSKELGVVLIHDINEFEGNFGVHNLWSEIKLEFETLEFLHGHGLGVVKIGTKTSDGLSALFDKDNHNKYQIFFKNLGLKVKNDYEVEKLLKDHECLKSALDAMASDLSRLRDSAEELSREIYGIKSSLLWRVTQPARKIKKLLTS